MGLSPDPEKRARQLRNLSAGWPRAEQKHGLVPPPDPEPELSPEPAPEPAPAPEPGLEVIDYATRTEKPAQRPRRAAKPRKARADRPAAPEPEPQPEPDPEPEPDGGGGFWRGFLGG